MILALADYLKYRLKKGRYSRESIEKLGGKLATRENFSSPKFHAKPGDILIYHNCHSFLSWLVMYYTNSVWSHTATFLEDGYVLDATTSGVIRHPFSDYLDGDGYLLLRTWKLPLTKDEWERGRDFAYRQIGCQFNWFGIVRFWYYIVTANHECYRLRLSLDFLIISALLIFISWPKFFPVVFILTSSLVYFAIVGLNLSKAMCRQSTGSYK